VLAADVRAALPLLEMPTLLLHFRENTAFESGWYIAERIANARFVEVPGADARRQPPTSQPTGQSDRELSTRVDLACEAGSDLT
jgi:hypothetical protein